MKFACSCGALILDGTDGLPHKGHVIGDVDWFALWDGFDAVANAAPQDPVAASIPLMQAARARLIWECAVCGRLHFAGADGRIHSYAPENGGCNRVLAR